MGRISGPRAPLLVSVTGGFTSPYSRRPEWPYSRPSGFPAIPSADPGKRWPIWCPRVTVFQVLGRPGPAAQPPLASSMPGVAVCQAPTSCDRSGRIPGRPASSRDRIPGPRTSRSGGSAAIRIVYARGCRIPGPHPLRRSTSGRGNAGQFSDFRGPYLRSRLASLSSRTGRPRSPSSGCRISGPDSWSRPLAAGTFRRRWRWAAVFQAPHRPSPAAPRPGLCVLARRAAVS